MIEEKDLHILRDELLYLNSKGKRVKRVPKIIFGGFYFLEVIHEEIVYGETQFINPRAMQQFGDEIVSAARKKLLNKILELINKRGKHV
jgi:hypothetical protein